MSIWERAWFFPQRQGEKQFSLNVVIEQFLCFWIDKERGGSERNAEAFPTQFSFYITASESPVYFSRNACKWDSDSGRGREVLHYAEMIAIKVEHKFMSLWIQCLWKFLHRGKKWYFCVFFFFAQISLYLDLKKGEKIITIPTHLNFAILF